MTVEKTIARLRDANPVTTPAGDDPRLFESIIARPGDPRLSRTPQRARRGAWAKVAVVAAVLTLGVSAAWAAAGGALELFGSNPQADGAAPGSLWDQEVAPDTVVRAAALGIPEYGTVEFWYADTTSGGWCGAIRLPEGQWAATKGSGTSGAGPGCYPTREQTNERSPVFVINGFDYYEVQIDARESGGSFWRVYYGVLSTEQPVAKVVDRVSGRRATVHEGRRFALAVPDRQPDRTVPLPGDARSLDLVAYAADGTIVAAEHR